jgi:hypothetical protein
MTGATKELVGIRDLLTRLPCGGGILRKLLCACRHGNRLLLPCDSDGLAERRLDLVLFGAPNLRERSRVAGAFRIMRCDLQLNEKERRCIGF